MAQPLHIQHTLQQKIVAFLTSLPNLHENQSQRAFILSAGLDPNLQEQLNFTGPPTQFFQWSIDVMLKYGTLEDGRHPLVAILEAAKEYVGLDRQAECDALIRELKLAGLAQQFDESLITQFPNPIAQACADFNRSRESVRQFVALDRLMTYLIKYLAAIFIGQVRRDKPPDFPLPEGLEWLARPMLENWADAIIELSRLYQQPAWRDKWQLPGILDACVRPLPDTPELRDAVYYLAAKVDHPVPESPSIVAVLHLLARCCCQEWESAAGQYPEGKIALLLPRLQAALATVLEQLQPLQKYPLVYTEWVDQAGDDVRLRLKQFMGRFTEDLTPPYKPPIVMPQAQAQHIKRHRLYVAGTDGIPLLDLHPIFVNYHSEIYHLQYHATRGVVEFRSCVRGIKFHPPQEAATYLASWLEDPSQAEPIEEVPPVLGQDEDWPEHVEPIPSDEAGDAIPLTWLNPEGRQALEIALGESLRIGRFWLGVEFLLMGLSKQNDSVFPKFLKEMGIQPGRFRGVLRGIVDVVKEGWRAKDVNVLGAEALPGVHVADHDQLYHMFQAGGKLQPVMTPRVFTILQDAVKMAGEGQVGHNQLLGAMLRHSQALPLQIFFSLARQVGWSLERVVDRLSKLLNMNPEELLGEARRLAEEAKPPSDLIPPTRKYSPGKSLLSEFGRDLTQLAQDGKLHQTQGEPARQAMTQLGRILLQHEANNPILIGDPGVGKTAIVEGFAWRMAGFGKGAVEQLQGRRVIELSANTLTAGTKYRGDLEERLQKLLSEVKKAEGQIIVFIDEIHSILSGGASVGLSSIADAIKPALARGEFPCIGATTVAEYRRHIEKDAALARRFTPVWIEEPTVEEAIQIVQQVAVSHLAEHHHVAIDPEAVETAVKLSSRYLHDEHLPGKAIKVVDQACSGLIVGGSLSGEPEDHFLSVKGKIVTEAAVLEVIANRTNIPVEQLAKTDKERLRELENTLQKRVVAQGEAIAQVARVVRRAGAGLADSRRPLGVFLFAGPTGMGKTELALALTEALFDDENAVLRLDMSEFMEKHQVARLTGAPPGYVGYGEEGQLTGHLRRRPYSVVLLDEIEKAHEDVQHLFLQLFDSGRLTDSHGRLAYGQNAIFIMTTNLGAKEALGFSAQDTSYQEKLKAAIDEHFTMEFLNRIDRIVYFTPLDEEALMAIFDRELAPFQLRFKAEKEIEVTVAQHVKQQLAHQAAQHLQGVRPLRRLIEDQIVAPVVDKLLSGDYQPGTHIEINEIDQDLQMPDTPSKANSAPGPITPGLGDLPIDGFGQPKPQPPKRPATPEEGLPHLDNVDDEHQRAFDERFLAIARHLHEQGITLEIDRLAKFFLCTPDQPLHEGCSIEETFEKLIEEPLTEKLLNEAFQKGDWVRIDYKFQEIVIEKI